MASDLTKARKTELLSSLLVEVQASTRGDHAEAIRQVREAFEARITAAVAYRVTQVLDAITGE
jgi:hypothetical protein